jgi:sugar porter (SP) family MFS transporter
MNRRFLFWIVFIAINGGLLFGLNMAGISGAVDMIKGQFNLSDSGLGTVAALLTIGCLIGAFFTGTFTEKFGRRKVMITTAILFIVSALGCALATSAFMLIAFRLLSGFVVGITSVVGPLYISEVSPASNRGRMVSMNQFAITFGILLAYILDYFLFGLGDNSWRYMLAIPSIFGIIYLIFLLTSLPESPRWLLSRNRREEAIIIMRKTGGQQLIDNELPEMEKSIMDEISKAKVTFWEIFRGKTGKIVLIGTLLAAFQQITGINAVIIFAPNFFQAAGSAVDNSLMQSIVLGLVNFLMTIVALWLVDTKGRRILLIWGALGMSFSLAFLSYQFALPTQNGAAVLIAMLVYISFFAASFAPVMWVVISELYSNRIRGVAMSFSTAVSWLCTFISVYLAPVIQGALGLQYLFGLFGLLSVLAFLFVILWIPETKGKPLEQIERELKL